MTSRTVTVPAELDQIRVLGKTVEEFAHIAGFDSRTGYACQLAVGEACENIIIHGYGEALSGSISLTINATAGELIIELCDTAPPFNPARKPQHRELDMENPPVGGLGLVIIHRVMDEVRYVRTESGNCLKLRKRVLLSNQEPHAA